MDQIDAPKSDFQEVVVRVESDYLQRIAASTTPLAAIQELIWNSLDADANRVEVSFREGMFESLEQITIQDDGIGIAHSSSNSAFQKLGGSAKRERRRTRNNRTVHGQAGRGRFRAFHLGNSIKWTTCYESRGELTSYSIESSRSTLGRFRIGPKSPGKARGTKVQISNIEKSFRGLRGRKAIQEITQCFALYLKNYPQVKIIYDNTEINPLIVQGLVHSEQLPPVDLNGVNHSVDLTVIEWTVPAERLLILCDENGSALMSVSPGIKAPGFNFTAYLKSSAISEFNKTGTLDFEKLNLPLHTCIENAKASMRDYFRKRIADSARTVVDSWKEEKVYPFEGTALNILEEAERQIFDVVAYSLHEFNPDFEQADHKSKKLALRLLKHALEDSPSAVRKILQDVLDLPEKKQEEFAALLERASLAAIINASKVVADRLDFISGLESLLFEKESKRELLERTQLHRILAEQSWIFGESYNLTVDDQSLDVVLQRHIALLKQNQPLGEVDNDDDTESDVKPMNDGELAEPVDGETKIVDLLLSRLVPSHRDAEREHLVVELKRPSQPINEEVVSQVKKYAYAVAKDERFANTSTSWKFIAVSNKMSESVKVEAMQRNRSFGLLVDLDTERIQVWVKTWGQIIEEARSRLLMFQEHLQYAATVDSGRAYLIKQHERYLPPSFDTNPEG